MSKGLKEMNPIESSDKKVRVTLDLSPEFYKRLNELEKRTYLGNKATVIRHALTIYEHLVTLSEQGATIVIRVPDGSEEALSRVTLAVACG